MGLEAAPKEDQSGEGRVVDQLKPLERVNAKRDPVVNVQGNVRGEQRSEGDPPGDPARKECAGTEGHRIERAEIGREHPRPSRERGEEHKHHGEEALPVELHGSIIRAPPRVARLRGAGSLPKTELREEDVE